MGYYEDLEIAKNATQDEIKKAYRRLSLKLHPDRATGDAEKFKNINEAYQTLSDENKRRIYDVGGNIEMGGNPLEQMFQQQFGGQDIGPGGLFKMFFNGMPMDMAGGGNFNENPFINITRNRKPSPINKTVEITLEGAYEGMTCPILIERTIVGGGLKKAEKETIYVDIPAGMDNNEIVIVENKGNVIMDKQGDIKLYIKISNNTVFQRQGLDLILKKEITLKEALTTFVIEFPHINGKKYKLDHCGKSIIKPDQTQKIQGLGMKRGNNKGSLIILFHIIFPKSLTEEQKEKIKEIL